MATYRVLVMVERYGRGTLDRDIRKELMTASKRKAYRLAGKAVDGLERRSNRSAWRSPEDKSHDPANSNPS